MTIEELEAYFKSAILPEAPVELHPSLKITDLKYFVDSHFYPLRGKSLPLNLIDQPLYMRLMALRDWMEARAKGE
jgi:hypothetical protein